MSNKKLTKHALSSSIMAMLLCIAMLVGTTFAWFTDTASTAVNKIQAGTLDIQLVDEDGNSLEGQTLAWKKAAGHESDEVLWEPGCTYELQSFNIKNNGNLALKYKIQITGINGDAELNEAIEWSYTLLDGSTFAITDEGHLTAGQDTGLITIKGHMNESAGNEYQGLSIDSIAITVVATQDTVEYDSNDNTYDTNSQYLVITDTGLADAIQNATAGDTVALASGSFELTDTIGEGVTISGNGAENTIIVTEQTGYTVVNDNVTISDVTVDGTAANSVYYSGAINLKGDNATIENSVINGGGTGTYGASVYIGLSAGETAYIKNTTISGGFRGIFLGSQQGSVVVDSCNIDAVYPISVDGGGDFTVTVINSKLHGWTSYSAITSATFTDTEFSQGSSGYDFIRPYADTTFTNCTFDQNFSIGSGATGLTLTLIDCTKDGQAITSANVQELLLDMTGSDGTNLLGCTIIVNGVAVTLS